MPAEPSQSPVTLCFDIDDNMANTQDGQIKTLEKKVHAQDGEIKTLEKKVHIQDGLIKTIRKQNETLEKKVHTQDGEIKTLEKKNETLEKKNETLEKKNDTLEKKVHMQGGKIKTLGKKNETLEKTIENMKDDITLLKKHQLQENQNRVQERNRQLLRQLVYSYQMNMARACGASKTCTKLKRLAMIPHSDLLNKAKSQEEINHFYFAEKEFQRVSKGLLLDTKDIAEALYEIRELGTGYSHPFKMLKLDCSEIEPTPEDMKKIIDEVEMSQEMRAAAEGALSMVLHLMGRKDFTLKTTD